MFENEIQVSLRHANAKYEPAIGYFLKHTQIIFSGKNILTKYSSTSPLNHLALGTD